MFMAFLPRAKTAKELEEELLQNLLEKYDDHRRNGSSEQEAFKLTVDSIGEVSELMESLNLQYNVLEQAISMDYSRHRLLDSDFRSVSVHDGKFNSCDLSRSDFSHSDLTNSTFKNGNLDHCIFENANLTGTLFKMPI